MPTYDQVSLETWRRIGGSWRETGICDAGAVTLLGRPILLTRTQALGKTMRELWGADERLASAGTDENDGCHQEDSSCDLNAVEAMIAIQDDRKLHEYRIAVTRLSGANVLPSERRQIW